MKRAIPLDGLFLGGGHEWGGPQRVAKPKEEGHPDGMALVFVVDTNGFEPSTSCVSSKRSNQLSYASAKYLL